MEFYVAKDSKGLHYFSDCPDLVKFNPFDDNVEWTGYPVDFGQFKAEIKNMVESDPLVDDLGVYDEPLHIKVNALLFEFV